MLSGALENVDERLAVVEQSNPRTEGQPYAPSLGRLASIMTNLDAGLALCRADPARARGDPVREVTFAGAALAQAGEADDLLRAMARYHLAETDWLAGKPHAAARDDPAA